MKRANCAVILAVVLAVLCLFAAQPTGASAAEANPLPGSALPSDHKMVERHPFSLGPSDPARTEIIRKSNADCLSCHSEQGLKSPPRTDMDMAKLAKLTISGTAMEQSVHAGFACTTCHGEAMSAFPHTETAAPKQCTDCHTRAASYIVPDFQESRHFLRHKDSFTCTSCHDSHTMRQAAKMSSPGEVAAADNATCLRCHDNAAEFERMKPDRPMPDLALHHQWLPERELHWQSVRCVDCHVAATEAGYSHRFLRIVNANRDCATCHTENSALRSRLYRKALYVPMVDEAGFTNAAILSQAYVIGATRNRTLDNALLALGALVVLGLFCHGALRLFGRRPAGPETPHRIYLFAGWIRLWHWLNALLMLGLAVSGVGLHFAAPNTVWAKFGWAHNIHQVCGIALALAYLAFVIASAMTGNWKQFLPLWAGLTKRMALQARFYLWGIFRGEIAPFPTTQESVFNPLQQVAYLAVMYGAMPALVATGVVFLFPSVVPNRLFGFDGLAVLGMLHTVIAGLIVIFTLSHIYLATTGRTVFAHVKSMITGWHQ